MDKDHPFLPELVELYDSVDMAMMSAERGDDCKLHAWLEEIRDEADKLVTPRARPTRRTRNLSCLERRVRRPSVYMAHRLVADLATPNDRA
jgi:hypothetical protein